MFSGCTTRGSALPLSYYIFPNNYYDTIPANQRIPPDSNAKGQQVDECGKFVEKDKMQDYEFQTEKIMTTYGLNLYDASIWLIAESIYGDFDNVNNYQNNIIKPGRTCEWTGIFGNTPCQGITNQGQCTSNCGFCYGDAGSNDDKSLKTPYAWMFKTISDLYSFPNFMDARCPDQGNAWTWNNWIPVLGENSWARLIGPLQSAYLRYGSIQNIPKEEIFISLDYIPSLQKMLIPSVGAIYYSPHNAYGVERPPKGELVSTENQASTLAGLRMLRHILVEKKYF